jgi:hypothetical protein
MVINSSKGLLSYRKFLLLTIIIFSFCLEYVYAQEFPPNNYRSANNIYYWKNKLPFAGYWQQDVYYNIEATLNDTYNIIIGKEHLTYWNNSPDTLKEAFFHLYQNSFQPGSYMDDLYKGNNITPFYGGYEKNGLGTLIKVFMVDNKEARIRINYSIMQVFLDKPIPPGGKADFDIEFNTYFDSGSVRRRMKMFTHDGVKQYDGVHWYPRISVYDRKFGWTTDQHLGREFYGDFGTYDVSLTLPSEYVLDGTGILINKDKVMPQSLRDKLDIKNFKNKNPNEKVSIITERNGSTKTWKFHAENVHDFAWTADPSYRIAETYWNGIQCIGLAQERVAAKWQNSAEYTARIIETYSKDIGMYAYPKIIVADARDGMEYPMLTLCGGKDPDYHSLLAHEVGHQWFFGMVANNETYRALMDEGFTQFLTVWCINKLDGEVTPGLPRNFYVRDFYHKATVRDESLYLPYLKSAIQGENVTLNTHSDDFNGAIGHGGGYGLVYYKTGTMLYNLQYVLGDDLFLKAMQHYFDQWKMAHPYPEDFRNSVIQFTHVDLNWFFDEWLETSKTIDYSIQKVKKGDSSGKYTIEFLRKGKMQMPIDFTVINTAGEKFNYYIPNTYFTKKTDATVLPMWFGWDKLRPTYNADITINGKLKDVIIDTTRRLADIFEPDNHIKDRETLKFDAQVISPPDKWHYEEFWRPDVWYNSVDGLKAGIHFDGNYMGLMGKYDFTAWYNTTLGAQDPVPQSNFGDYVNFNLSASGPICRTDKDLTYFYTLRYLDGLSYGKLGFEKKLPLGISMQFYLKSMEIDNSRDLSYQLYPSQWETGEYNSSFNFKISKTYSGDNYKGSLSYDLRIAGGYSSYSYGAEHIQWLNTINIEKFVFRSRFYLAALWGDNIAPESQLYLAGANPEDMMDDKFLQARGFVPYQWLGFGTGINHFQEGGGLNLRGYAGYLAPNGKDTSQVLNYKGLSGASVNLELDFDKYIKIHPPLISRFAAMNAYLFYDAGTIDNGMQGSNTMYSDIRMDAGLGLVLTITNWGVFQKASPLSIRCDFPLFINASPDGENNFQFRWVLGLGRTF